MSAPDAPRPFALHTLPLSGFQVVEASAGTGKTRTITGLVLRLILEQEIAIEDILVITYTVAATEELRDRIRTLLGRVATGLRGGDCADDLASGLVARVVDRERATGLVRRALADFDLAGVHTIHAFCRRALVERAFEGGMPFASELVPDLRDLLQEVVDDFWRRHVAGASPLFAQHLLDEKMTPDALAAAVARHLGRPDLRLAPFETVAGDAGAEADCLAAWERLRRVWPESRTAVEELLRADGLKQTSYRRGAVPLWLRRMDAFLRTDLPDLGGFEQLPKLTARAVAAAWKKGATARTHPALDAVEAFVDACGRTRGALARRLRALKIRLLVDARAALAERARRLRVQSFDDLLLELQGALARPPGADLAARLRTAWRAVLVDEFQDTDPAQYDIVRRIWVGSDRPVFVVGDPKQAIYRFRGADVYAYLRARHDADERHDLLSNWRSEPALVAAVNTIFAGAARPFVIEEIPFRPADPARQAPAMVIDGAAPERLRIWFLEREETGRVLAKGTAARRAAEATAAEIARLLRRGARLPDGHGGMRDLEGGDVAVLVRSHRQGRLVGDALARRGVASVQQAEDSVFASREADQLRRVLLAVADPGRDDVVRAALGTELLDVTGERLVELLDDDGAWTGWLEAFHRYHQLWREHGVGRMFRALLAEQGVAPRLLEHADGERRLTNLLHLGELLQESAARQPRGLDALVRWMAERAADERPAVPEQQLRLESDEHVVKIVTVHKSKGLEYPVVFCPFAWDGRLVGTEPRRERDVVCHDAAAGDRATLEIESERDSPLRVQAVREELAEQLRLFYVGLTRAVHRCTIVWGATGDSHTAAPFWLLHAPAEADTEAALRAARDAMDDATLRRQLAALVARSGGTIRVEPLPDPGGAPDQPRVAPHGTLSARPLRRRVGWAWRMTSFTGLTAGRADGSVMRGEPPEEEPSERTAFGFPRGARAGSCLHAVFEGLDVAGGDAARRRDLVARALDRFGFAQDWAPALDAMVERVLATPLDATGRIRLGDVPPGRRLQELEFTYPLSGFDAAGLRAVLRAHGMDGGPFAESLDGLDFAAITGFMRGFVDLVFESHGRYWLADYKSNWLGPAVADYETERLPPVMAREAYWLQYLIYLVALHRLLRLRLPDYDYDRHVGGVFYLFVRGMDPALGARSGVFHDRPSRALVEALDDWIGGGR